MKLFSWSPIPASCPTIFTSLIARGSEVSVCTTVVIRFLRIGLPDKLPGEERIDLAAMQVYSKPLPRYERVVTLVFKEQTLKHNRQAKHGKVVNCTLAFSEKKKKKN